MITCGTCGEANPERARFCLNCGAQLSAPEDAPRETRKTVTVVFADISGSTAMGERLDPEATRALLARYFAAMREILERHGGTVEKFIGDAVMAVFGVPMLHEDDALRAVRAAAEMRERLVEFNAASRVAMLQMHIGVGTGEVVAGSGGNQLLVTGDAVNVASRLEEAATPGEIFIDRSTEQLVRSAVSTEPIEPLSLKGKADPVPAFRLLEVGSGRRTRADHFDAPLAGRQRELRLLHEALERASAERSVHLVTLLGEPGVGKSRLVHEFLAGARATATVLRGRGLPYGEGITYWPIGEMVRTACQISPDDLREVARRKLLSRLGDLPRADEIASHIAAAIGLSDATPPREQIFWAILRLLEFLAAERPLLLVLDDLQWAEPTLVELLQHVLERSGEVPMLLVCMARPDLFEHHPSWASRTPNATTLRLGPLTAAESGELLGNLPGAAALPAALRERVAVAAEGNPLFVEEFVGMLRDTGRIAGVDANHAGHPELAGLAIPPSIAALLGARLDALEPSVRDVTGRAAVVGETFKLTELIALTPEPSRDKVPDLLHALGQRGLVRPDRSASDEDVYRFGHLLIRDAAYAALPKERRAALHQQLAGWLEASAGDRLVEVEEIIAHHLEAAHRYRTELAPEDQAARDLAERAIGHLTAAGARARERGDARAAGRLFERAVELAAAGDRRRALWLMDVGIAAEQAVDRDHQERTWRRMRDEAATAGAEDLAGIADMQAGFLQVWGDPTSASTALDASRARLERVVQEGSDPFAAALYWHGRGYTSRWRCQMREAAEYYERAAMAAAAAQHGTVERLARRYVALALVWGPNRADEVVDRVGQIRRTMGPLESTMLVLPLAQLGRAEDARRELAAGRAAAEELTLTNRIEASYHYEGLAELTAGNLAAAEWAFRKGMEMVEPAEPYGGWWLAFVLARLHRRDEAADVATSAQRATHPDTPDEQALWRMAMALVAADRDDSGNAERMGREAVEFMKPTDELDLRGDTHRTLADVLDAAGRHDQAITERREALRLYEAKGVLPKVAELRAQLGSGPGTGSNGDRHRRSGKRSSKRSRPGAGGR